MGALRTPREKWVEEGLRALAEGGVEAVRVDALAKRLGVTRGGFYGYFTDREALLEEMLDTWERQSVDAEIDRVEQEGGARDKAWLVDRFLQSADQVRSVDLALRDWARRDQAIAERMRRVDNKRMRLAREMIGTFCSDPDEVEARALLAFCLAIGSAFLAADHPDRSRAQVIADAAELVLAHQPEVLAPSAGHAHQ
ncbi:TetR/AcrR family transcriptional regulator [Streptomyces gardneri]|uniref:TetR/AcrR family transcriptional regulator n=1 Tax=Nocardia TaxID=1817 RepID=UPI00135CD23F|nr:MULTISPECIES: TetR/AcrR family transcriptional regulator [Nocardia]MBF6166458.1 TetR/AcrR family transcriptional regulator [Streptomyces gardneri]MBF6205237.1 TetR/AcrR family transcriptional regulator [Streptomyces gardneri]